MTLRVCLSLSLLASLHHVTGAPSCVYHDYCVLGAGPGGLQVGYFLESAGRDYIVFERSNTSGSFFELYPRHRKLISINKRHTGKTNVEFNLRHDWNSLLSPEPELRFGSYSQKIFPHADELLDYLRDFQKMLGLKVQFNTVIGQLQPVLNDSSPDGQHFHMTDQNDQCYTCRTVITATGVSTPKIPDMTGILLAQGYENISIDPNDFEGKSVLILGKGNSAFEVAEGIYGATSRIHMVSRSALRLAWATHYVGDLRAVNNALLDTYQLKSLDGLLELSLEECLLVRQGDRIYFHYDNTTYGPGEDFDNHPTRQPYDVVVRALGFTFDYSIFNSSKGEQLDRDKKYPPMNNNYESTAWRGLFYAGTLGHAVDFKKSAGGFIHGFRYTARALHRLLEWRYHRVPWPSVHIHKTQLLNTILKRLNEASGIYQMFQYLGDVAVLSEDGQMVTYLEEFPILLLPGIQSHTGVKATSLLVIVMEYGKNFSDPGHNVFKINRAVNSADYAHVSNFLHPVIYHYKSLPTEKDMDARDQQSFLPRPDSLHHILEDFLTHWDAPVSHILPLRRFLENVFSSDLRTFFAHDCFRMAITFTSLPDHCVETFMKGQGFHSETDAKIPLNTLWMRNMETLERFFF